jgi:hypothetical protein
MHAFVGIDINKSLAVAHTLPYTVASWGCGSGKKGSYNRDPTGHIQFEICEDGRTDANYYHDVFALVEDYCVYLCKMFGFTEKNITSHYEAHSLGYASNHGDPRHWMILFGDSMDKFRARVAARLAVEGGEITAPQEEMESDDKMSLSGWNVRVDTKLPAGLNLWSTKIATNRDSLKKVSKGSIMKCLQDHEDGWATCEFEGVTGFADMKYLTATSKFETVPAPVPVEQDTVSKDEILRGLVVIQQGIDVIRKAIA